MFADLKGIFRSSQFQENFYKKNRTQPTLLCMKIGLPIALWYVLGCRAPETFSIRANNTQYKDHTAKRDIWALDLKNAYKPPVPEVLVSAIFQKENAQILPWLIAIFISLSCVPWIKATIVCIPKAGRCGQTTDRGIINHNLIDVDHAKDNGEGTKDNLKKCPCVR